MCAWLIWVKISVFAAAGVMQLTRIPLAASSFASDLVKPISPAFEAL